MKHYLNRILGSLTILILVIPIVTFAKPKINVINCSAKKLYIGAADWDNASGGWVPYTHAWLEPNGVANLDCLRTWGDSNAPGCKIVLNYINSANDGMGMGRKSTGNYYAYFYRGCYIFRLGSTCPLESDLKKATEACE